VSCFLFLGTKVYNADGKLVPGTSHVLLVDATVQFLSEEHLPFAITAFLILAFTFLPPMLLILYPCKVFKRCRNCCSERQQHALRTFVEAFQGCYKTGEWDFRSMSGVYLLLRFVLIIVNIDHELGWLLRALMLLSLSILTLIVQPYKKSYMNVLDGLLLAVLGLLVLLLITFLQNSRGIKALPLILVIICGFPQFVFLLIVTYRKLKGK